MSLLNIVRDGLEIALPPLTRPPVPNDKPNEELVLWGTNYYTYSVIAHLRIVLTGMIKLIEIDNVPSAFVLCRHVFEWTAHACYMSKHLGEYISAQNWAEAWQLQSRVMESNRWVKEHGNKYASGEAYDEIPDQLRLKKSLAAYADYQLKTFGSSDVDDSYALLSEHSHPNSACFASYWRHAGAEVHFGKPSTDTALLGEEVCLIHLVQFLRALLYMGKERTVLPQIHTILDRIIQTSGVENRRNN